MKNIILSLFTIYQLSSSSSRRLLQPQFVPIQPPFVPIQPPPIESPISTIPPQTPPIPPQIPLIPPNLGYYNQVCVLPLPDFKCQSTAAPGIALVDAGSKKIECGVDYSCCMCRSISCGHPLLPNCDEITVGGNYGAYGVQEINIYGPVDQGAFLTCGGSFACSQTIVNGVNMNTIGCNADNACAGSIMTLENSKGLKCGQRGCMGAKFIMSSNSEGDITCAGPESCLSVDIQIQGIGNVKCNGQFACKDATIWVTNPVIGFALICNGDLSCENLQLVLYIPAPTAGCPADGSFVSYVDWKGITCGSPEACKGMQLSVVNDGCSPVRIEDLECSPNQACVGAIFNLEAGTGPFGKWVELTNCKCNGISCQQATGIDRCYNNLREMSCPDNRSCLGLTETVSNPANGFRLNCPATESCMGLILNVIVSGASNNLIQNMDGLNCVGISACYGATVTFINTQLDQNGNIVPISVQYLQCRGSKSCEGLTIITGVNVNIASIVCSGAAGEACTGCIIKQFATDIIGKPCDSRTVTLPPV